MENRNKHIIAFIIIALVVLAFGIILDMKNDIDLSENGYRLVLIEKDTGAWYYEIHYARELKIRQEFVPGISGNIDFDTRKLAERTGRLVLAKLQNGELPVLSAEELKKNGITN